MMRKPGELPERCCERCLFLRYEGKAGDRPICVLAHEPDADPSKATGCQGFASEDKAMDWSEAYAKATGRIKP